MISYAFRSAHGANRPFAIAVAISAVFSKPALAQAFRKPILAECSGMMALAESLTGTTGTAGPMAGLFLGEALT